MIQAETWRAALLLMWRYGPAASAKAALQAAEHFARGDAARMVRWQRVVDAIVELQSERRPDGETVH
jgi:hypothetical protein